MPLWLDKHAPKTLEKLDFNKDLHDQIKNLIDSGNFPHLLLYGPSGAGKKTRVKCILKMLYGNAVTKLRLENYNYQTPSKKKLEIATISSNFHLEVNPTDAGIYDRLIIQELIKQIASTVQLDQNIKHSFKIVVLHDVDRLTREAQHALRRTMEKFINSCRLILCCESTSRIISPTLSRCLLIRVRAPTEQEVIDILRMVSKKESLDMPLELATRIAKASDRNLRRALLMAEVARVQCTPMKPDQSISEPDWKKYLEMTARMILDEQSPKKVLEVRGRLYDLLSHCIPPDIIIKGIVDNLMKVCDQRVKLKLVKLAGEYEFRMKQGSKPIFHLEAFVVGFMAVYKRHIEESR